MIQIRLSESDLRFRYGMLQGCKERTEIRPKVVRRELIISSPVPRSSRQQESLGRSAQIPVLAMQELLVRSRNAQPPNSLHLC